MSAYAWDFANNLINWSAIIIVIWLTSRHRIKTGRKPDNHE